MRAGTRPERIRIQCLVLIIRLFLTPLQQQQQKQLMMNADPFNISQPLSIARVPEGVTQAASVDPPKTIPSFKYSYRSRRFYKLVE